MMAERDIGPVAADRLAAFVAAALSSQGVPDADAAKVAQTMVDADIYGYGTHGVFRLRQYMARLRGGGCNPKANIKTVHETVATALIDGDNGLGHLAMIAARDLAIEKARIAGIGWVGVRSGNHAGPLALYVRPQADAGLIGMAAAVGSANHVPPFGGTDLLLGTNPIAISAPSADADPFVMDMATTVVARGKIRRAAAEDQPIAEGLALDADGRPTTDAHAALAGTLAPIGGPKGYGLALMIELLTGFFAGGSAATELGESSDFSRTAGTCFTLIAARTDHLGEPDARLAAITRMIRASGEPGEVLLPGEIEERRSAANRESGLSIPAKVLAEIDALL